MQYIIKKDYVECVYYIYSIENRELIRRYAGPFNTWSEAFKFKTEFIKIR